MFLMAAVGGTLERLLDPQEYPNIGEGLSFPLQTVATVGYGHVTPAHAQGRIIAAVLMVPAIGFLAAIPASPRAALVEGSRQRIDATPGSDGLQQRLDEVNARVAGIEAALGHDPSGQVS